MQIQTGNILDINYGIITHQVNCKGVMGAGLAKALRSKYPVIFPRYREFCLRNKLHPGMVQFIQVTDALYICNLAGQDGYGKDKQYTDYAALVIALAKLCKVGRDRQLPIYLPYNMGCGLAGGDWPIVSELIDLHCPDAIIVKRPSDKV